MPLLLALMRPARVRSFSRTRSCLATVARMIQVLRRGQGILAAKVVEAPEQHQVKLALAGVSK